jgi:hypothetical protein
MHVAAVVGAGLLVVGAVALLIGSRRPVRTHEAAPEDDVTVPA